MQSPTTHEHGFTLMEIMAVIAIIGILTSIVIANYGPARERTAFRNAHSTMETMRAAAGLCVFQNTNLNNPSAGARVCDTSEATWPDITINAPGWAYTNLTDGNVSDETFSFGARGPENTITCTQIQCTTN
jgi:prepilin-type N-terminal cleavage/methylation domain-containing protein